MADLAPVKASWDRVIRTTVGLRPHRDAGFMLRPDKLDDKLEERVEPETQPEGSAPGRRRRRRRGGTRQHAELPGNRGKHLAEEGD